MTNCLDILELYAVPQFPEGVIFQHNGASSYYDSIVCEFLDATFSLQWISKDSVKSWPP